MATPTPSGEERRNFRLGVWNGAVYQMGEGFIDPGTVVPVFLSSLTRSNALIGFCTSLPYLGWLLPQFLVVPHVAQHARQLWLYRRAAVVRGVALGVVAALAWPLGAHPRLLLGVFLAGYVLYCFGGGVGGVPFMEVVSKTVPRARLGDYWAQRLFWGGVLSAGVGLLVRELLRGGPAPWTWALLFALSAVFSTIGYACFCAIHEPPGVPASSPPALALLREGVRMLRRDAPFRRLFIARAALPLWLTASPFVVLFALHELGGGTRAAGTFLFARVVGFVVSNLGWQHLSRRRGNRVVMMVATTACSALALLAAAIAFASPWSRGWLPAGVAVVALEVLIGLGGAAESGILVGYASLVIERAPLQNRQRFVALMNTFVGATMVLPALGGAVVDHFNAPLLFALCSITALFGVRAARRLEDAHLPAAAAAVEGSPLPGGGVGR